MLLQGEIASAELAHCLSGLELLSKAPDRGRLLHHRRNGSCARASAQGGQDVLRIVHASVITGQKLSPWIGFEHVIIR